MQGTIAVIGGDGVGREIVEQGVKALRAVEQRFGHSFTMPSYLLGEDAYKATGNSAPPETIKGCQEAQAVLFGAIGGVLGSDAYEKSNTASPMLVLRGALKVFCNLRPIKYMPALERRSPLKPEVIRGADFVIVREMSGGIIPGRPKGLFKGKHGRWAVNTTRFTEGQVNRVLRLAFLLAQSRRKKLAVVAQNPPLEVSRLWRQLALEMAPSFPDVEVSQWLPDAAAMQMIRNPRDLDVVVVDELITAGILSDAASVIMASLGMPPSAELHAEDKAGDPNMTTCTGMYQPVHGSVPHRKGKDMVNPCATILSAAMLLRHSFNMDREARAVEDGVEAVLAKGYRTYDVMEEGCTLVGTARMGDLVAEEVAAGRS